MHAGQSKELSLTAKQKKDKEESFWPSMELLHPGEAIFLAPELCAHTIQLINIYDHHHLWFNFSFTTRFSFIQCLQAS